LGEKLVYKKPNMKKLLLLFVFATIFIEKGMAGQRYAQKIIKKLQMKPHPEGGFYSETYRSPESASVSWSGESPRNFSTAIYFLLKAGQFSAWHRLHSDEMWHHYEGGDVKIHVIDPQTRELSTLLLGRVRRGGRPQVLIPRDVWFCAEVERRFSLVGCTVTPGFDFADFEMATRADLVGLFPEYEEMINKFTRV